MLRHKRATGYNILLCLGLWRLCGTFQFFNRAKYGADVVLPAWMPPHTREYPTRLSKGALWTLLCLCLHLGLWWLHVSRSGQFYKGYDFQREGKKKAQRDCNKKCSEKVVSIPLDTVGLSYFSATFIMFCKKWIEGYVVLLLAMMWPEVNLTFVLWDFMREVTDIITCFICIYALHTYCTV